VTLEICCIIVTLICLIHLSTRSIRAKTSDLKESAEMHRRVYKAIRNEDPEAARVAMGDHLEKAQIAQEAEVLKTTNGATEPKAR